MGFGHKLHHLTHKVTHAITKPIEHVAKEIGNVAEHAAKEVGHAFSGTHHQAIADLPSYTTINNQGVVNIKVSNLKDHTHTASTPTTANGMTNGFETIHTVSGKNIIINN